jgi:hypothetical protein
LRWQKVRRANVPKEERRLFEQLGETAIQMVVAGTVSSYTRHELMEIYRDTAKLKHAEEWLVEQTDLRARRKIHITIAFALVILVEIVVVMMSLLPLK